MRINHRNIKSSLTGLAFCAPGIIGIVVVYLLPLCKMAISSLQNAYDKSFCGLQNYRQLLGSPAFQLAAFNTLKFWGVAIPLNLLIGLLLALLLAKLKKEKVMKFFWLPYMIPVACCVVLWQVESVKSEYLCGILLMIYLWKSIAGTALILLAGIRKIPIELTETAQSLGANPWQLLEKVYLPLLMPSLGIAGIWAMLSSFRVFREAYLLGGTYPERNLYSLQHFYMNNFMHLNRSRLAAASVLQELFTLAIGAFWLISYRKNQKGNRK